MKLFSLLVYFLCLLCNTLPLTGQDLATVQDQLKPVATGKYTYRQEIKTIDEGMVQYLVVAVDSNGKETETLYHFSLADIDHNTVRSLTKKDVIVIQLLVSGKQKLIQVLKNGGDKVSYANELQLFATDSENGDVLESEIKSLIPKAVEAEEKRLSLSGYEAHKHWLTENIGDVELPGKQIIQKVSPGEIAGKLTVTQTVNAKNKSNGSLSEFNLATLNPNSVGYRISGDEFIIRAETRRAINGIRYFENDEQKNYKKELKIYANSISNGKDIYKVLKAIIPLAETAFEESAPDISTSDGALGYINSTIATVGAGEVTLSQNLSFQENGARFTLTETAPDKSTDYQYHFNFADLNANTIDYDGQKQRLFVTLPTKKKVNFIQTTRNGDLQNYTDDFKIYCNTIEEAIIATRALKTLVAHYEAKMEALTYPATSLPKTVETLGTLLPKVTIGEDTYDLFIELSDPETQTVKVTTVFSNLKKSVETVQEFSLKNINPGNCNIVVKGKHVLAELNTKHLEKIVKTYVDGDIKPYQYKVAIETPGIEAARQIVGLVKNSIEKL